MAASQAVAAQNVWDLKKENIREDNREVWLEKWVLDQ